MKILATFDGTPFSESTIPLLQTMAGLPNAEFILMTVDHMPKVRARRRSRRRPIVTTDAMGRAVEVLLEGSEPTFAENEGQAIDRRLSELSSYLGDIVRKLSDTVPARIEAHIGENAAQVIIEHARSEAVDVIVMATHSRSNLVQALFGSVAEDVVRSGVAPVLLVHPPKT
jgi:nucleotide-binding universal stress UspA family protein